MSILRRLQRQARFARRKIETATAWAAYVEAEQQAGRVPMDKRTWRTTPNPDPDLLYNGATSHKRPDV